jgi:hypothetical protein
MIGTTRIAAAGAVSALLASAGLLCAAAQTPAAEKPGCYQRRKLGVWPSDGEVVGEFFRMSFSRPWGCSGTSKKPGLGLFNRETLEFIHVMRAEGSADSMDVRAASARDWCQSMEGKVVSDATERIGADDWRVVICKERNPSAHKENYFAEHEGRMIQILWSADDPPRTERKSVRRILESFVWTTP